MLFLLLSLMMELYEQDSRSIWVDSLAKRERNWKSSIDWQIYMLKKFQRWHFTCSSTKLYTYMYTYIHTPRVLYLAGYMQTDLLNLQGISERLITF